MKKCVLIIGVFIAVVANIAVQSLPGGGAGGDGGTHFGRRRCGRSTVGTYVSAGWHRECKCIGRNGFYFISIFDCRRVRPTRPPTKGTTQSPPEETTQSPPEESTQSPPEETTQSPPEETTQSPPEGTTGSPPEETTQSPPEGTTESPPEETTQSQP